MHWTHVPSSHTYLGPGGFEIRREQRRGRTNRLGRRYVLYRSGVEVVVCFRLKDAQAEAAARDEYARPERPSVRLACALDRRRLSFTQEAELQDAIEAVLQSVEIAYEREVPLSDRDRPDFLLADGCAVEIKTRGAAHEVARQLLRYASHDRVRELLLITTRSTHLTGLPLELGGKPLRVYRLTPGL